MPHMLVMHAPLLCMPYGLYRLVTYRLVTTWSLDEGGAGAYLVHGSGLLWGYVWRMAYPEGPMALYSPIYHMSIGSHICQLCTPPMHALWPYIAYIYHMSIGISLGGCILSIEAELTLTLTRIRSELWQSYSGNDSSEELPLGADWAYPSCLSVTPTQS